MLRFTRAVALQRRDVSDVDFRSLGDAGFDDARVTEIVANIALNIFTNYFNSVAQTEIDFPVLRPGVDVPETTAGSRWPDCPFLSCTGLAPETAPSVLREETGILRFG